MKQITNITILVMVLSIPFALSQTRKAIPAGRYEALSGIKTSHTAKQSEQNTSKESFELLWQEVTKHLPIEGVNTFYIPIGADQNLKNQLQSKGVHEVKKFGRKVNVYFSDNLLRDGSEIKQIKTKGSLIVVNEKRSLKEVMSSFEGYELLFFNAENQSNYYLFKLK